MHAEGLELLPVIQADERRLFNAFYNVIDNAIPEVPPGGSVTVRGRVEAGAERLLLRRRYGARDGTGGAGFAIHQPGDQPESRGDRARHKDCEGCGQRPQGIDCRRE